MYGKGDCNNQFTPSPLEPQFSSIQNAPPPPIRQVYPLATSQNRTLPPRPPPNYQALQLPQHDHQGHSTYHHVLPSSVPPPVPQATVPTQTGFFQHGSTLPPPPVHCGPLPPLRHVPPPTGPVSSHPAMGNFGQTYAASPTAHGSLVIPPPYSGSQTPSSYPQHLVPQNLQRGMPPPSTLIGGQNFPKVPAPPPPLPGPIIYRPNQVSQHGQPFPPPPPPPSFVPVAPTTFMRYGECPITHAPPPPPLSPPLQPPPPPPSPPPLPTMASQQEIVRSPGHPVRDDQVMDTTELDRVPVTKSVQTENLSEILVSTFDSNLSKDNAQILSSSPNKVIALQAYKCGDVVDTFLSEKQSVSPPQPSPNPSKQEVASDMALEEFGDPNYGLQHASEHGSSSAPASDEAKSTKQIHMQTSEASPHNGLADREMMLSPSLSDMDMEDDVYSPTKDFPSHHLLDSVKVQPAVSTEYEKQLYASDSPAEQSPFQKTSLLLGALSEPAKLDTKEEEEGRTFSAGPAFEDLSSTSDSPEANGILFDRPIHTSPRPPVENPQFKNPQPGIAKPCVEDVSSFKLLPNYASDDSTDEDVNPKTTDVSPVKASSELTGSLDIDQDFCPNNSNLNSLETSEIEMLGLTQVESSQTETSALPCTGRGTDPNSSIDASRVPSEVQNDACHSVSSQPLSPSLTMGLSPSNEQGEHDTVAVDVNPQHSSFPGGGQLHQEEGAQKPSSVPKVDEFGRLIREGASDSESDDRQYSRRLGKRRRRSRSRSRSLSPQESRWRKTRSPRRRRDRRSHSRSWSPKKVRNRSRSPVLARPAGHSDEKTWRHREHPAECFNFRRGRCFRGASCRFLHRDPVADDPSRQYGGKGRHYSEKHGVVQDVAGDILEMHEAKERSGHGDMALITVSTSNLLAEPATEGASLAAYEVQSTPTDATQKVGEQVSKELQGSNQTPLPVEHGAHSPNEKINNLIGSSVSPNLSVDTGSQVQLIPEGKKVPEEKLHEPAAHPFQELVAAGQHLQDDDTNVNSSLQNKGVGSCLPTARGLMPSVEGGTPHSPKPVILSHPLPSDSHTVTHSFTAESSTHQQLPTRDFQSFSTSGDFKLHPAGAMASRDFTAETSIQHLAPPQSGDQIQLKPLQQSAFPSFQPTSNLWPLPPTFPEPRQSGLPLPTHVNELHLGHITKAPDFYSPYQPKVEPLKNEFVLPQLRRPYQSDESMQSQQVGFFPRAQAIAEPQRPTLREEDPRPWSFASTSAGDQSFGGEAFARDLRKPQEERFVYPTNAEGPKSEPLAFRTVELGDRHSFPRPGSQLPGQPFNTPVAVSLGNSHSQPFSAQNSHTSPHDAHSREGNPWDHHYPREHSGVQMHNLPREDMAPRPFARAGVEGVSSFSDITYSGNPSAASSSLPPQDGSAPPLSQRLNSGKGPAFPEYPETFLTSNRSSLLSVIGRSQVPRTHYNPYASTFEEKPSKFEPQFDLSRVPLGTQIGTGLGSRSFGSSAALLQVNKKSSTGDQYDPLFDSIEPSKKDTFSKFSDVQDRGTSFDAFAKSNTARTITETGFISRLENNQMNLLNVEETSKLKGVGPVVAKQFDIDELGEATDAEAGAVENVSPMAGVEKDWSPDHPVEANIDVGEVEIDQAHASGKGRKSKDSRSMKLFKIAVAEFVKDVLKPSWRQGNMSKEAFKTIVKKTVDKVSGAMQSHQVPKSKAKIDQYVESSQRKLTKLVMGYVDKYVKS